MAITKTFINDIRAEIASVIEAGDDDLFGAVAPFPVSTLEGFPAVVVMLAENDVAFASTGSQDSRKMILTFSLNVFYPATKQSEQEKAEEAMGEAVSQLLKIFCVKKPLTKADLASVGVSPWGETVVGEATYRTASVILTVSTYVDTV
jgi:hypothetical protein